MEVHIYAFTAWQTEKEGQIEVEQNVFRQHQIIFKIVPLECETGSLLSDRKGKEEQKKVKQEGDRAQAKGYNTDYAESVNKTKGQVIFAQLGK